MNDEHKPESTYRDEWFAFEDGLIRGRGTIVLSGPYAGRILPMTSDAPAGKEAAQPMAQPELLHPLLCWRASPPPNIS